jgi:hypothetical protein
MLRGILIQCFSHRQSRRIHIRISCLPQTRLDPHYHYCGDYKGTEVCSVDELICLGLADDNWYYINNITTPSITNTARPNPRIYTLIGRCESFCS